MVNNNVVYQQNVYIDFGTQNKSFIDIHLFLKDIGIVNNAFFLVLMDPDLAGVNPVSYTHLTLPTNSLV